jgi:hypothetical protein
MNLVAFDDLADGTWFRLQDAPGAAGRRPYVKTGEGSYGLHPDEPGWTWEFDPRDLVLVIPAPSQERALETGAGAGPDRLGPAPVAAVEAATAESVEDTGPRPTFKPLSPGQGLMPSAAGSSNPGRALELGGL